MAVQLAGVVECHMALALPPNQQLKDIRNRLGITTRDVAEFSQKIAQTEDNTEFHISNAWLTQIENSDSVPSIFKLYSLSSIYRIKFSDILLLYGVDLQNLLNTNYGTVFESQYDYTAANGGTWLNPTTILGPRFARVNLTFNF